MKITMLGTTGSGKTVYMSALSQLFFHADFEGYKLANRENSFSSRSFIYGGFSEINTLYSEGAFPYGTTTSIVMPLELKYKSDHVIDIDWIDYRGQAIAELAKGVENPDNAEILAALLASDVVMVFVDAAILKDAKSDIVARIRVGANEISQILSRVHEEKHFDLMFLLTKADSSSIRLEEDLSSLKARVGSLYSAFFSETNTSVHHYHVIPVGALGIGNVVSERIETPTERGGKLIHFDHRARVGPDELKPYNIASSFACALLLALESESKNLNTSANQLANKLERLKANFGPVRALIDILFFGSRKRIEMKEMEQIIQENRSEIRALRPHRAVLERIARGSQ